jgi:membrane dipeptidase
MNRRELLKLATVAAPAILRGRYLLFADSPRHYSARCIEVVQRSLVIDMLSQFKLGAFMDVLSQPGPKTTSWFSHPETFTAADFARYGGSGINAFHIGWGYGADAYDDANKILAAWNRFIAAHPDELVRIDSAAHLQFAKRTGKVGIILGFQNAEHFRTVSDVEGFYAAGQRVSQLTYNVRNALGSGYEDRPDGGLTAFGAQIVARMNTAGIAVDLSHCGDRTTVEALAAAKKPAIISHANCRALNPHPRCKTDAQIRQLAAGGGVMGISAVRMFVRANSTGATIEDVLDHFDHVTKLVGVEHVGVGSDIDLDGYDKLPPVLHRRMLTGYKANAPLAGDIPGLDHPQRIYDLTEGLIRRGYSDGNIELILGGNFRRALSAIWNG